jgi:hypothetical protein
MEVTAITLRAISRTTSPTAVAVVMETTPAATITTLDTIVVVSSPEQREDLQPVRF